MMWCNGSPFLTLILLGCVRTSLALASPCNRREWWEHNIIHGLVGGGVSHLVFPNSATAEDALTSTTTTTTTETATATTATTSARAPYLMDEYLQRPITAPTEGGFYFPTLTPPFAGRATHQYNLGRKAYAFEQLLTFANVSATIRCNVIELEETGGLWVHSPQWPTGEFCYLLDKLGSPVEHIVLPANAIEHKAPIKAFANKYPSAKVWISPGQYGPFGSCGLSGETGKLNMGYRVDGVLGENMPNPPSWLNEFDMATLYVDIPENAGPVSEVAFCHRPTKTLVATDAVVYIPSSAPEIFSTYFDDTEIADPTFWPKTVLQAVFLPLRTTTTDKNKDDESSSSSDGSTSSSSFSYPGFDALENRLVRAPILRAFADARAPDAVRDWVARIAKFDFNRIITSHFAGPIGATPHDFASCFEYLGMGAASTTSSTSSSTATSSITGTSLPPIACQDWELLEGLNQVIAENKLGAPATFDYKKDCR